MASDLVKRGEALEAERQKLAETRLTAVWFRSDVPVGADQSFSQIPRSKLEGERTEIETVWERDEARVRIQVYRKLVDGRSAIGKPRYVPWHMVAAYEV